MARSEENGPHGAGKKLWAGWPSAGKGVTGSWVPPLHRGPREPPPPDNVFQVLGHQKQRSFSLWPENEESSLVAEESFSEAVIFGYSEIWYFTGNPAEVPVI